MVGAWRPILRAIDRRKAAEERALAPQSINLIVKRRCALVGLDATEFTALGLRSGYLTEAARRSIPLPWTMQQWQQCSVQQVPGYKSEAEPGRVKASRLTL
jgi:hypothetical protein